MARGGKREGAGRPFGSSVLDEIETIIVAAEISRRWKDDVDQRMAAAQREYFGRSDYRQATSRVRASRGRDKDALDDVEFSRREMAGIDADSEADAPRGVRFEVARPYGIKRRLLDEVAEWASEKFGKPVSVGVVKRAWAVLRHLDREDV